MKKEVIHDCIIVGAGAAGTMTSIQLKRAGLKILLLEKNEIGGLVRNAQRVENILGYPKGISGKELAKRFKAQLKSWAVHILHTEAESIKQSKSGIFSIHCKKGRSKQMLQSKTVVLATGTQARPLQCTGAKTLQKKHLFYEIVDLPKIPKNTQFAVIGAGDAGVDYALHLKEKGHKAFLVTAHHLKAFPLLKKRLLKAQIPYYENCAPQSLKYTKGKVKIRCAKQEFTVDYVLVAIGRIPKNICRLPDKTLGLWRVGDLHQGQYRQIQIAAGDALKAAMEITNYLHHATLT